MKTVIGVALLIVGTIWFLWSLYSLRKGRKSEDWHVTTGIVTESYVTDLSIQKGHGTCPIVHYEYSIHGKTFKSDRIFWGNVHLSGSEKASQQVVDKYKKGYSVTVFYNPQDIEEAVLEPGPASGTLLSLAVSCIPIVVGIVQLLTGFLDTS